MHPLEALHLPHHVVKRSGESASFESDKIHRAIELCFRDIAQEPNTPVQELVRRATNILAARYEHPTVEDIQDIVEFVLQSAGEYAAAKHYILYRAEHAKQRQDRPVPDEVKRAFTDARRYFPTPLQEFQFFDKYSRFSYDAGRRETWVETVDRSVAFLHELAGDRVSSDIYNYLRSMIIEMRAMPSMRLLAMAGPAARRNNISIYNCSYLPVDSIDSFVEALIISMSGCGVGFSVERRYVEEFPRVARQKSGPRDYIVIEDSSEGWAMALRAALDIWFNGGDIEFDYSQLRSAGAPLRTKGGRACLTADTVVYRDKKKWGVAQNCQTIGDLYKNWQAGRGNSRKVTIRCLDETTGKFFRNRVKNVVYNGLAPVYQVTLENGYTIKATDNHRFMRMDGRYSYLEDFKVGDVMAVNGIEVKTARCCDCGQAVSRRAQRCAACANKAHRKDVVLPTTSRQRPECRAALLDTCERCDTPAMETVELHVHHIDRNPLNNDSSNLICLCEPCHHAVHSRESNDGTPHRQKFISYAKIVSIEYAGVEPVYDIQMEGPNHNFVANGYVSHNSGPEPLRQVLDFIRSRILARQGSFLRPLDAHDIMCAVGNAAVSGGVRRTAMLSLFDFDDDEMAACKRGNYDNYRWNANNSAVWPEGITQQRFLHQFIDMIDSNNGEPGIFNRPALGKQIPHRRALAEFGTNPCVTGDTWVAVADGRGRVRMKDLASANRDVDVFTVKNDALTVRTMRNPRKTGHVPVLRVGFSDGTHIKVSVNHKFVLSNGDEVRADTLKVNDSLASLTVFSYKKRGLPKLQKVTYDEEGSYRFLTGPYAHKSEHRFLWDHYTGDTTTGVDYHIHHFDNDGRNNDLDNLIKLTAAEHAAEHRDRMLGDRNPAVRLMNDSWKRNLSRACTGLANGNAKKLSNEQLREAYRTMLLSFNRMPSQREFFEYCKTNGLPVAFTAYRLEYFECGPYTAVKREAQVLGFVPKHYGVRYQTDLPMIFIDSKPHVLRACEKCGMEISLPFSLREISFCRACSKVRALEHRLPAQRAAFAHRRKTRQEQQVSVFNSLLVELGRSPMKKEWQQACKATHTSAEIGRTGSPFTSWETLKEAATVANHRVTSIEPAGVEDVYTGTVDDTHTFFTIGSERANSDMSYVLSVNCGEIILRPFEFCNLSIAVARSDDSYESLVSKIEAATIIGTIQSLATDFKGLRPAWRTNCEEERLLGVDINGQMDCHIVQDPMIMAKLRQVVIDTNHNYAQQLGINRSAAVTCVKPGGNSSVLLDCSSGLHPRWSPYYVRNVRVSTHSPIFKVLQEAGAPMDPENGQTPESATTWVVHFPVRAPENALTRHDRSALQQCQYWLDLKLNWTEHNPSVTITYKPDEVIDLAKWIWDHKDYIGGMSFLPTYEAEYEQLPNVEITKDEYERRVSEFPALDWSKLYYYEESDMTTASQEVACLGGACELKL